MTLGPVEKLRATVRLSLLMLTPVLFFSCQTFVDVDTGADAPIFTWRTNAPVTGLMVLADEDCDDVTKQGNHGGKSGNLADRIWWQVSGNLHPPVKYGVTPKGATELAAARPLSHACSPYTVTLTDPSFQGVSSTFRPHF